METVTLFKAHKSERAGIVFLKQVDEAVIAQLDPSGLAAQHGLQVGDGLPTKPRPLCPA